MKAEKEAGSVSEINARIIYHIRAIAFRTAVFTAGLIFMMTCVFCVRVIESNDMYPAIRAGDLLLCYRLGPVNRQSAVLYRTPKGVNVGRIQALSGDVIGMTDERELTVNGIIQPVQKRMGIFTRTYFGKYDKMPPYIVSDGHFFILGDERENARDSREYGPVSRRQIIGSIFMIIRRRTI